MSYVTININTFVTGIGKQEVCELRSLHSTLFLAPNINELSRDPQISGRKAFCESVQANEADLSIHQRQNIRGIKLFVSPGPRSRSNDLRPGLSSQKIRFSR